VEVSTLEPRLEQLRQGFRKYLNPFMLGMWRLGLGAWFNAWPEVSGRVMVITHTGRKTGRPRRTPVNFAMVDDELYCLAAFGGVSDWYRNMLANPHVEVWLPDGWWVGAAEDVSDCKERLPLVRQVMIGSGFAARVAGLNPYTMSDEDLEKATATYRLVHIRRTQARTGPGGPGDLAWVWPVAAMVLLPLAIFRRGRRSKP
jgi:deazaflavin-dependent oxidoreductase (nitroreductase family)